MKFEFHESLHRKKAQNGIVLLSVTWIVLILSLLLLSQLKATELRFDDQNLIETDLRLRMASKTALNQVIAGMASEMVDEEGKKWDAQSDLWGWPSLAKAFGEDLQEAYPGITITVSVEDESSKVNLGSASVSQISDLVRALGWGDIEADDLAVAIREKTDEMKRLVMETSGQEGQKNAEWCFESTDLHYLTGLHWLSPIDLHGEDMNFNGDLDKNENDRSISFPPDNGDGLLNQGLTRFVSLRAGEGINPNFAPKEVLLTVPGVTEVIAEEILLKRLGLDGVAGTEDDFIFTETEDLMALSSISRFREFEYNKMKPHMRMTSDLFTIRICAEIERTGQVRRIQTCLKRDEDGKVQTLAWLEDKGI